MIARRLFQDDWSSWILQRKNTFAFSVLILIKTYCLFFNTFSLTTHVKCDIQYMYIWIPPLLPCSFVSYPAFLVLDLSPLSFTWLTPLASLSSMTKDLARKPRFTRATASSNQQNDIYGLNGSSDMPLYSTLKALYDGQTWFGPQYARGMPGRKSIERFEAVKRLIEVYIRSIAGIGFDTQVFSCRQFLLLKRPLQHHQ